MINERRNIADEIMYLLDCINYINELVQSLWCSTSVHSRYLAAAVDQGIAVRQVYYQTD